jgi:hypothetical protein
VKRLCNILQTTAIRNVLNDLKRAKLDRLNAKATSAVIVFIELLKSIENFERTGQTA